MKSLSRALSLLFILSWVGSLAADDAALDRVLVKFEPDIKPAQRTEIAQRHELTLLREITLFRIFVFTFRADTRSVEDVCAALRSEPGVSYAEPDQARSLASVNDPNFSQQWYLSNTGQTVNGKVGPSGVDIRWLDALSRYQPQGKVRVAVVDSGTTLLHPEIVSSLFVKSSEANGVSGVDDDNNGLVDDLIGYDFYSLDSAALDQNGHGTLVAGIIGGTINNSAGGAGITNAVEIIPYRVFDQFGRGGAPKFRIGATSVSDVLLAVATAVDEGAKIINLSLGGSGYNSLEKDAYDQLVSYGVIAVIAAGNGGTDGVGDNNDTVPTYPASYSSSAIISVAAQQRSGALATFSNYGPTSVDIAAPGTDIYGPDVNRQTIFSHDFNGTNSGWLVGRGPYDLAGVNWTVGYSGSDGFLMDRLNNSTYAPWTDSWVMSPYLSLVGRTGARLEFEMLLLIADDVLVLEVSSDGINWIDYAHFYGADDQGYSKRQIDISDLDGSAGYFRFRLLTNGSWQDLGAFIDNVRVSGIDIFDQSNPRYQHSNGTSFAAPIVSGVAAMVWAHRPDLSAQQVRNVILQSRRSVSALSGKVCSGGMVDANAALILAEAQPKKSQTISFSAIGDRVFNPTGSNAVTLAASVDSGLGPVVFSVTTGPATILGNTLNISGPGTVSVTAIQAGNLSYSPAAASQTFTVAKAPQSISFSIAASRPFSLTPISLNATTTSGLSPLISVVSGPATISGNQLTLTGTGTVVLRANQTGDSVYAAAFQVEQTTTITTNFDSWRFSNFSTQELNNAGISGPSAIRGVGGFSNLLRYAFGLNLLGSEMPGLQIVKTGGTWEFVYSRASDRPDLSYLVESSTDLLSWSSVGITQQKISTDGTSETWHASVTGGQNRFFRLRVDRNP